MTRYVFISLGLLAGGCTPVIDDGPAGHISSTSDGLSGCRGHASNAIPSNDSYYLTTFGGPGDSQIMSCGESTKNGSWYYIASRQRFGCGAHVRITTGTRCVVAVADDYGPDVCVEQAAGRAIIDSSPLVAEALFGTSSAGWSDHDSVSAVVVADSTPLGPCSLSPTTPPATHTCESSQLGRALAVGQCVQSSSDDAWYQCTDEGWYALSGSGKGPLGWCTAKYPLQ